MNEWRYIELSVVTKLWKHPVGVKCGQGGIREAFPTAFGREEAAETFEAENSMRWDLSAGQDCRVVSLWQMLEFTGICHFSPVVLPPTVTAAHLFQNWCFFSSLTFRNCCEKKLLQQIVFSKMTTIGSLILPACFSSNMMSIFCPLKSGWQGEGRLAPQVFLHGDAKQSKNFLCTQSY